MANIHDIPDTQRKRAELRRLVGEFAAVAEDPLEPVGAQIVQSCVHRGLACARSGQTRSTGHRLGCSSQLRFLSPIPRQVTIMLRYNGRKL